MTDKIEIQGKTVEAAVSEALLQMGARRDEVEIKILEEPKAGFMGFLGGRAARVLVRKKQSRRRGGSARDHRVDDDDYKAHNLSSGRGRGRSGGGSGRRPAGNATGGRDDNARSSREPDREKKSGSRRGSRGRGGRGRNQEAAAQSPKRDQGQGPKPDQGQGPKQDQNQGQRQGQPRSQAGGRGGRNRRGLPRDNRAPVARGDVRQDNQAGANKDRGHPARNAREEAPVRPLRQEREVKVEAPVVQAPREETKPIEQKVETSVTKPNKPRRSHGGLGSRLREKRAAAKEPKVSPATPAESQAVSEAPAVRTERSVRSSPAPERQMRERRPPSFSSSYGNDEMVLGGIKGVKYAKPLGSVTEEGLDEALTELTDGMLARAGFPCRCETFPGEYRQVKVTTDDASAGMLIGRHGQAVDAVEHLVERMASNSIDARARINLDINNYRMRREESLAERVAEASASIKAGGKPVHMEPMSARERRIVHMETAEIGGLRTFTMDGAGGKHVVIVMEDENTEDPQETREEPEVGNQGDGAE